MTLTDIEDQLGHSVRLIRAYPDPEDDLIYQSPVLSVAKDS